MCQGFMSLIDNYCVVMVLLKQGPEWNQYIYVSDIFNVLQAA